jgi:octaprenyl-diphosphate synthase
MQTTLTLGELYKPVQKEMDSVREAVADLWSDALRLVHGAELPEPPSGGKMLRPALCMLSARASGAKDTAYFVPLATAMELLHLAALAHDDVIDGSDFRRGVQSLNALWDNHTAVLGGDYLVARAISIMSCYDSCAVITSAIDSVRQMAEGELVNFGLGRDHHSKEACISLARQKTASLFAVTCSTPSCLIEGAPRQALYDFGMAIGIAFQLVDDALDLSQDRETLGKPAFGDIVEGKRTLPILYMREALDAEGAARLDALRGKPLSASDQAWVGEMFESTGARERTEAMAREYVDEARAALAALPPSIYRDSMHGLAEFVLVRGS